MNAFFRVRTGSALALLLLTIGSVRCSAAGSPEDGSGGTIYTASGGRTGTIIDIIGIGWTGGAAGGLDQLDPRCGDAECSPDDPDACDPYGPGGAGGEGGGPALGGFGGLSANPGDLEDVAASCQVRPTDSDCDGSDCEREAVCLPTGTQGADASCLSAEDCGPGLACIDIGATVGVCKPYCCEGGRSCTGDTYCSTARLLGSSDVDVPVCAPLDDCNPFETHPCPPERECTCTGDLACTVVRPDGRTACAPPGGGQAGDDCESLTSGDCAHGLVCSPTLGCMQICQTMGGDAECAEDALCQSPSGFPTVLGVCIGPGSMP